MTSAVIFWRHVAVASRAAYPRTTRATPIPPFGLAPDGFAYQSCCQSCGEALALPMLAHRHSTLVCAAAPVHLISIAHWKALFKAGLCCLCGKEVRAIGGLLSLSSSPHGAWPLVGHPALRGPDFPPRTDGCAATARRTSGADYTRAGRARPAYWQRGGYEGRRAVLRTKLPTRAPGGQSRLSQSCMRHLGTGDTARALVQRPGRLRRRRSSSRRGSPSLMDADALRQAGRRDTTIA